MKEEVEEAKYIFVVSDGQENEVIGEVQQHLISADGYENPQTATVEDFIYNQNTTNPTDETIWSMCDNALEVLVMYLMKKHKIITENTITRHVHESVWENIMNEFNTMTGFIGLITLPSLKSKVQNLINKNSNLFQDNSNFDESTVINKCQKLSQKLQQLIVTGEAKIGKDVLVQKTEQTDDLLESEPIDFKQPVGRLKKLRNLGQNFIYGSTPNSSMYTMKKVENQIKHEMLNYEREKWKIKAENQILVKEKLRKQNDLADVNIEKARIELELLKSGLYIPPE